MTEEEAKDGQGGCQGSRPGVQGGPCGAATHAAMRWGCAAGGGAGSDPGREQGQVWIWGGLHTWKYSSYRAGEGGGEAGGEEGGGTALGESPNREASKDENPRGGGRKAESESCVFRELLSSPGFK